MFEFIGILVLVAVSAVILGLWAWVTKSCPRCHRQIAWDATKCPHCTADL